MITNEVKEQLIADYPTFEEGCRKFFNKEMSMPEYKKFSGQFGSYAERGMQSAMSRWRFAGGEITQDQLKFMAEAIRKHNLEHIHFTSGQCIQMHGLDGETVLELYKECYEAGIYNRGAGGDNVSNFGSSPLHGVDPNEAFDTTPYIRAGYESILPLFKYFKLPRKMKIAIDNGNDDTAHTIMKDIGFHAMPNGTFEVYMAGGIGPAPQLGIKVADNVAPEKINYYIKAMIMLFTNYGNYKNHNKARTRYIPAELGGAEEFKAKFKEILDMVFDVEELDIKAEDYLRPITKTGVADDSVIGPRVGKQKQEGLYWVEYHPVGGDADRKALLAALDYVTGLEQVEGRLTPDEGIYFINLTADEARKVLELLPDAAETDFERSVSCVGKARCQIGMQDSAGLLKDVVAAVKEAGVDMNFVPRMHISGCPSSCGTHQVGPLGFQGSIKLVDKVPTPAFAVFEGGSEHYENAGFGMPIATVAASRIPDMMVELGKKLQAANATDFYAWKEANHEELVAFVKSYE
ncbi:MAG: nitrite/sulfite reductase [Veillonella sp.]|nr:nitrite/sulfite reductase [Veillonella sp.]